MGELTWQQKKSLMLPSGAMDPWDDDALEAEEEGEWEGEAEGVEGTLEVEEGEDEGGEEEGEDTLARWQAGVQWAEGDEGREEGEEEGQDAEAEAAAAHAARQEEARAARRERWAHRLSGTLLARQQQAANSQGGRHMAAARAALPAHGVRQQVLAAIDEHQVLLVTGETGCGKSTQVPQYLLEAAVAGGRGGHVNVVVTQPRRISAIALAKRVAAERCEEVGVTVGYKIRHEGKTSPYTRLTFCTTGLLLRRILNDPDLSDVTHVFVDEIHERHMQDDFLLIVLRDLLLRRPDLRLVLMSATLDTDRFSQYFGGCPRLHIPGRTFPVDIKYLEDVLAMTGFRFPTDDEARALAASRTGAGVPRALTATPQRQSARAAVAASHRAAERDWHQGYRLEPGQFPAARPDVLRSLSNWFSRQEPTTNLDLVAETVAFIHRTLPRGGVLVFLTGLDEIEGVLHLLQQHPDATDTLLLPLHSSLPTSQQQDIFNDPPPGVRKVVLATNIAETSITVNDVVYVVDAGQAKEKAYDSVNQLATLLPAWVSRANAKQRAGRAGRVQPGRCFRLYPRPMYEGHFAETGVPELLRTPLSELILQIKFLGLGDAEAFLGKALDPPAARQVSAALELLTSIGALDPATRELTPLGRHLALLPVDPLIGKMIVIGACVGCLDPVLTIAAAMSVRDPFLSPLERRDEASACKLALAGEQQSDHLAMLAAYKGWLDAERQGQGQSFCRANFLSGSTMELIHVMRQQLASLVDDIGFLPDPHRLPGSLPGDGGLGQAFSPGRALSPRRRRRGGAGVLVAQVDAASVNAEDLRLVKAVLCAGMYPNVALVEVYAGAKVKRRSPFSFHTLEDGCVSPHPGSVNDVMLRRSHWISHRWLIYSEKVKTSQIWLRSTTAVSDLMLLLFGGTLLPLGTPGALGFRGNALLRFNAAPQGARMLQELQAELQDLLQRKVQTPSLDVSQRGAALVSLLREVLALHDAPAHRAPDGWVEAMQKFDRRGGDATSDASDALAPGPPPGLGPAPSQGHGVAQGTLP